MPRRCGVEITHEELRYVVLDGPQSRPRLVGYGRIPLESGTASSHALERDFAGRTRQDPGAQGRQRFLDGGREQGSPHLGVTGPDRFGSDFRKSDEGPIPAAGSFGSALADALARMRRETGLGRGPIRAALATQATVVRVLSLPMMPEEDLELILAGEADKEQRILGEEMAFGFCLIPAPAGENRRSVLLALTPKAGTDEVESALGRCGRRVEALTTASLAVLTWTHSLAPAGETEGGVALLHLGADRMILTIAGSEGFRQFRDLGLGMDASLLEQGRATGTDGAGLELDWDALDQIGQGLSEVTQVAAQVRQTLVVDERQHPERPVGKLYLAGDVTRAEAMAPLLENELGLPVFVLDPLDGIERPEVDSGLRTGAASLALPLVLARPEGSDGILHLGKRFAPAIPWRPWVTPAAILSLALLMGFVQGWFADRAAVREARIEELVEGSTGQALADGEAELWVERNEWLRTAECTAADPLLWLSASLPPGIHLNRADLAMEKGGWRVDFEARASSGRSGSPLEAWPALRDAWRQGDRVMGLELPPPLGTVSPGVAPDMVSGVLRLRGGR